MITLLTTKYTSIVIELLILCRVCHMPSAWAPIEKKGYANQRELVWNIIQKVSNYGTDLDIDVSSRKYCQALCTNIYWKIYQRFLRKQNEIENALESNHFFQRGRKLKRISRSTISCALYKNMVRKEIWLFFLPSICCWRFRGTFIGLCISKHSLAAFFTNFFRGRTLWFILIKNIITLIQKTLGECLSLLSFLISIWKLTPCYEINIFLFN